MPAPSVRSTRSDCGRRRAGQVRPHRRYLPATYWKDSYTERQRVVLLAGMDFCDKFSGHGLRADAKASTVSLALVIDASATDRTKGERLAFRRLPSQRVNKKDSDELQVKVCASPSFMFGGAWFFSENVGKGKGPTGGSGVFGS
jgi:hypothetical protein